RCERSADGILLSYLRRSSVHGNHRTFSLADHPWDSPEPSYDSPKPMKLSGMRRVLVAIAILGTTTTNAEERAVQLAGMKVTVWSQKVDNVTAQPVIVFSHGFHGCATQSRFLMEALASAGYLVLAPNHRDATCNGGPAHWLDQPQIGFRKPE